MLSRVVGLGLAVVLGSLGCAAEPRSSAPPAIQTAVARPVPTELTAGATLFAEQCAGCHGESGLGTTKGPTFLSSIYVPSHHADAAFQAAVLRGVVPHHHNFGPMPPVPGLSTEQVTSITRYVRWLQQQAGVR